MASRTGAQTPFKWPALDTRGIQLPFFFFFLLLKRASFPLWLRPLNSSQNRGKECVVSLFGVLLFVCLAMEKCGIKQLPVRSPLHGSLLKFFYLNGF